MELSPTRAPLPARKLIRESNEGVDATSADPAAGSRLWQQWGHFNQFPPTSPSVGYRFGERTFEGATCNGQDAPTPVVPETSIVRLQSTLSGSLT